MNGIMINGTKYYFEGTEEGGIVVSSMVGGRMTVIKKLDEKDIQSLVSKE